MGTIGDLTDGQLLERFATDQPEVAELAFSALVERHEALVWRVCLAILRDRHDAEDAFQVTFLVLIQKARSLWVRDSLGPWLHQVACRTASCLRAAVIRRRKHEERHAARDATRALDRAPPRDPDRAAAVHEAVSGLPEKYRAPLLLCDLEGRTHEQAARFLGWPIGTVKSRHSHGRRLLRDRLVRRGLAPAAAAGLVESLKQITLAAAPQEISRTTVAAAMQQAARSVTEFGLRAHVVTLTHEVLRAMLWNKLQFLAIAALAVGIATAQVRVFVFASQDPSSDDDRPASKRATATPDPTLEPARSTDANRQSKRGTPEALLRAQKLATRKAKVSYEIARANRELAEIAVEEYETVTYPSDLDSVEGDVNLARSDLSRSEDRRDWARRMFDKGYVSEVTKNSEELSLKRAVFSLEQAQSKKDVLVRFTRGKMTKHYVGEVEKAHADELAKERVWIEERAKEIELERQGSGNSR
jgi:RNA polymerase sigma factor (sigma-70 family)